VWCVWGRCVGTYQSTAWPGCPTTGTGAIIPVACIGTTCTTCAFPCVTPSGMPFSTSPSCIAHHSEDETSAVPSSEEWFRVVFGGGLRWSSVVFGGLSLSVRWPSTTPKKSVANSGCLIVFGEREKGAPITTQKTIKS
jgi:hypothetical protein